MRTHTPGLSAKDRDISLERFTQQIERALQAADVQTKQEVIRLLIERIVVTDEAMVHCGAYRPHCEP